MDGWLWFGRIADVVGTIGVLVATVAALRAKSAADAAKAAAVSAKESLVASFAVDNLADAVRRLDELKAIHRDGKWEIAIDRYTPLRRALNQVRISHPLLAEVDRAVIGGAIEHLVALEKAVEGAIRTSVLPARATRFNELTNREIDKLEEVLGGLQARARR